MQTAATYAQAQINFDECYIHHWFDLPDGTTVPGNWDLRARWRDYFGNINVAGERVLELGPASGFLSLKMEQMGAQVTALELPDGAAPDLMPIPGLDMEKIRQDIIASTRALRRSWLYFHQLFGSKNQCVSGDIYNLPTTIGRFDTTVMGAILLHLQNPFAAVLQAAKVTDSRIVIVEQYDERLAAGGFMEFDPNSQRVVSPRRRPITLALNRVRAALAPASTGPARSGRLSTPCAWWLLSPLACQRMLEIAGFPHTTMNFHEHDFYPDRKPGNSQRYKFFTVVGTR
jgi:O-methyltransferase